MRRAFIDSKLEETFNQNGWLVYDLHNPNVLADVDALANETLGNLQCNGFFVTFQSSDISLRRLIGKHLQELIAPEILPLLYNYKSVTGNFFVNRKLKDKRNGLGVHLDWSHLNEHVWRSIAAWVPLVDCNIDSGFGQLGILVGSHEGPVILRGSSTRRGNLPPAETGLYAQMEMAYSSQMLNIARGQVFLFEHRLAHFSTSNECEAPRIAAHVVFIPIEAELLHYREEDSGEVQAYCVDPQFFTDFTFTNEIPGLIRKRSLNMQEIEALKRTLQTI